MGFRVFNFLDFNFFTFTDLGFGNMGFIFISLGLFVKFLILVNN